MQYKGKTIAMRNVNDIKKNHVHSINSRQCFEKLSKVPDSHLVDVRTKPEWLFVGLPNLQSLQKKTVCVSWHVYPNMEINVKRMTESGAYKRLMANQKKQEERDELKI